MNLKSIKVGDKFPTVAKMIRQLELDPKKSGKSKIIQLKEIARYINWENTGKVFRGKVTNEIVITEIYDIPIEKVDKRKMSNSELGLGNGSHKSFPQYITDRKLDHGIGVYTISVGNDIYVGSTITGFRERFIRHTHGKQQNTKKLLDRDAYFKEIWVSDVEDEYIVRSIEQIYIDYFRSNKSWNLVNTREEAYCMKEKIINNKPKEKEYQSIKILKSQFNIIMDMISSSDMDIVVIK
ncbi:MAG: hypothetical protein ACRC1P_09755 [Cellulosilyticaceae bacterium]